MTEGCILITSVLKRFLISSILVLFVVSNAMSATQMLSYGFEDWSGDATTTSGYIFGSNASGYWDQHVNVTHVVESCTVGGVSWTPKTGSYFWYTNAYEGESDSCLNHAGHVGTYAQFGMGPATYGNNPDFHYGDTINYASGDRELYAKFDVRIDPNYKTVSWVYSSGSACVQSAAHLKLFRTYTRTDGTDGGILYLSYDNKLGFCFTGEVSWSRNVDLVVDHDIDLIDGEWHTVEVYLKLQDTAGEGYGTVQTWVDGEQIHNSADLPMDATDNDFVYSYLMNNFSSCYPTGHMSMAVDNIEIWDGIPTEDTTAPTISNALPSGNLSYEATKTISVTTSESANCRYHASNNTWATMSAMSGTGGTSHTQSVNVVAGNSYSYNVICQDSSANESTVSTITFSVLSNSSGVVLGSGGSVTFGSGGTVTLSK